MSESKVLLATDFEGDVVRGLELATQLAADRAATLLIVHVIRMEMTGGEAMLHDAVDLIHRRVGQRLVELVPTRPEVPYRHIIEVGDPERCIAAVVEREAVDFLVLGARRRSGLSRFFGRGLADRLRDAVDCPVVHFPDRARSASKPQRPHQLRPSAEALTAILDVRVDGVLNWMTSRRQFATAVAERRSIRDAVASLERAGRYGLDTTFTPRIAAVLGLELEEHRTALGALSVEVLMATGPLFRRGIRVRQDAAFHLFTERLQAEGTAVSVPLSPAEANGPHIILAGAKITLPDEDAYLVFSFDARQHFLRILGQPGPGATAETYAFDAAGLMLSNSRFPDQLQKMGLLSSEPGAQTARRLRICDPGHNLLQTFTPTRGDWPLTRMAADATSGRNGCDWRGYRDYRGVDVIGAWRWIPEYGFGVAAEVDQASVH